MINKDLGLVTKEDIDNLVLNEVSESRTLEYKEKLPGNNDEEKKEFLADISSFANSSGGDILYGVPEKRIHGKTTGLPDVVRGLSNINVDEETRRLNSILQDGLSPRVLGIRIEPVHGFPEGSIIIIRVPKSWNSPHMVSFKKSSRFFARNSAGKHQLDITEIRSAFIASESLAERIRQFRGERIAKIISDETPIMLSGSSKIVLHVLPLEAFNFTTSVDIVSNEDKLLAVQPISASGWDSRYNFDGLCNYSPLLSSYAQFFRNGCIEAVEALRSPLSDVKDDEKKLSRGYEAELIQGMKRFFNVQKSLNFNPPIVVALSLLNVKGYKISSNQPWAVNHTIDRDHLLIPEILVETDNTQPADILRPAFDAVWQACGHPRSLNYDSDGNWKK